jgi:hypothetical protein
MSDRRYSTGRWQQLRKAVLAHYGYVCQIQGPRCRGYATSVHHLVPSSQAPHLFWQPGNLVAACGRCNYGDGSRIAAQNTRTTIERLRAVIEEQEQQIAQMPRGSHATRRAPRPNRPAIGRDRRSSRSIRASQRVTRNPLLGRNWVSRVTSASAR